MKSTELSDHWQHEAYVVAQWYQSLLTKAEIAAFNNLRLEGKASAARSSKASKLLRSAKSKEKEAVEELKEGPEFFLKKTLLRVMVEHGNELVRCPRCRLIITPMAIVCDHCYLLLKK